MITLTREEAQQVLDVLKDINKLSVGVNAIFLPAEIDEVMETLRTELTKPEPELVAWTVGGLITDFSRDFSAYKTKTYTQPLYTTPPQREWVGLTDEEYEAMAEQHVTNCYFDTLKYAKAIEAKLKDNNYDKR